MIKITKKKVCAALPQFLYGDRGIRNISFLAVLNPKSSRYIKIG
jgi:hypothetical protein